MEEGIATPEGGQVNPVPAAGVGETWWGGIPDELKSSEVLSKYKDSTPDVLAKDHLSLHKQFTDLQSSLPQVPESPDKYEFDVPDGVELDQDLVGWFKTAAFENKVPADAAKNIVSGFLQKQQEANERAVTEFNQKLEADRTAAEDALKKQWGVNYEKNVEQAQRLANKFLPPAVLKYMNESGFGDNPELVQGFFEISKVLSEDVLVVGETSTQKGPPVDSAGRPMLDFSKSMGKK